MMWLTSFHVSKKGPSNSVYTTVMGCKIWYTREDHYTPLTTKLLGGILVSLHPSVCPSVCPSVPRPSRIPCPLCSFYSCGWIHYIFMHLIKQLQKVCRVQSFLQNSKIWNFGNFLPEALLAYGYCHCLRLCVCVCLSVCVSTFACPDDNSTPIQARFT